MLAPRVAFLFVAGRLALCRQERNTLTTKEKEKRSMTGKVRMYIGVRNDKFHRDDGTDEFEPIVTIEMDKIIGGKLLQMANGGSKRLVRLYAPHAGEIKIDGNRNSLTTVDARDVIDSIKADMAERPDQYKGYRYDLALSALELLAKSLPSVEVVFDRYTYGGRV